MADEKDTPPPATQERPIEDGRFDTWSLADFAGQCRMQARENLDPEYSEFMTALSRRLSGLAKAPAPQEHVVWSDEDDDALYKMLYPFVGSQGGTRVLRMQLKEKYRLTPSRQKTVVTDEMDAVARREGYGDVIETTGERPSWIAPDEIVARHLPCGLSERKAEYVTTWHHDFRVRADHPHYQAPQSNKLAVVGGGPCPEVWFPWSGDIAPPLAPSTYIRSKFAGDFLNGENAPVYSNEQKVSKYYNRNSVPMSRVIAVGVLLSDTHAVRKMEEITGYRLPTPAPQTREVGK